MESVWRSASESAEQSRACPGGRSECGEMEVEWEVVMEERHGRA